MAHFFDVTAQIELESGPRSSKGEVVTAGMKAIISCSVLYQIAVLVALILFPEYFNLPTGEVYNV